MHEFTLVSPAVYSTSIGRGETELPTPLSYLRLSSVTDTHPDTDFAQTELSTPLSYLRLSSVTDTHPDTDFAQTELSTLSVRLRTDMSPPQI